MNTRDVRRMVSGQSTSWVEWTCATCGCDMEDPPTIKATECRNGHVNYLGKVEGDAVVRRAFKTQYARRKAETDLRHQRALATAAFESFNRIKRRTK